MKKMIATLAACALCLSFAACGGSDSSVPSVPQPVAADESASQPESERAPGPYAGEPFVGEWRASSAILDDSEVSLADLDELGGGDASTYEVELRDDGTCYLYYQDTTEDLEYGGEGTWRENGETEDGNPLFIATVGNSEFDLMYNAADNNLHLITPSGTLVMRK